MRSCLTSRPRAAPMASRTLTSRSRVAARDSMRLATLAQPISSTAPTAASMIQSAVRSDLPTTCSGSGTRFRPYAACVGSCSAMRFQVAAASARARSSVMSGASRPTT